MQARSRGDYFHHGGYRGGYGHGGYGYRGGYYSAASYWLQPTVTSGTPGYWIPEHWPL